MTRQRFRAYVKDPFGPFGYGWIMFFAEDMNDAYEFARDEHGDALMGVVLDAAAKQE